MSEREIPQAVIDRILKTYDMMVSAACPAVVDARSKVIAHVTQLWTRGETDPQRLTVSGLAFLRELGAGVGKTSPVDEAKASRL